VYANTAASFERGYADIAECLKLPVRTDQNSNVKLLVQAALSQRERGHWILIIDNADDIDVLFKQDGDSGSRALVDYLPDNSTGSIIFTARTRKAAESLAKNNMIQVDEMSRDDTLEVLRETLHQRDLLSDVLYGVHQCERFINWTSISSNLTNYTVYFMNSTFCEFNYCIPKTA